MAGCSGSCPIQILHEEEVLKKVSVSVDKDSILSKVTAGKSHVFYTDETSTWGGNDKYPDPWDYILGGLGSCITVTLRQYADRHSIPLESAEVSLEYKYDEMAEDSPYKVLKKIKLVGNLTKEEKDRLILVSNSPAQKMLARGMDIKTLLI